MTGTPDFVDPPIVELIISAQFSSLPRISAGHFGLFWKEIGDSWLDPGDGPPIPDQFELFDRPRNMGIQLRLESATFPGRFTLRHKKKDRLLQIQSTRFCLNWRKRDTFYPSYRKLIGEFEDTFACFTSFIKQHDLGPVAVNQWELTYIDAFWKGEYWTAPAEWASFLPGLFGQPFAADGVDLMLENRAAEWSYEIKPQLGRLHINAAPGRIQDDTRDAMLLTMTARGPVGKERDALRAGLDLGHDVALGAFLRVVSTETKKRWEAGS